MDWNHQLVALSPVVFRNQKKKWKPPDITRPQLTFPSMARISHCVPRSSGLLSAGASDLTWTESSWWFSTKVGMFEMLTVHWLIRRSYRFWYIIIVYENHTHDIRSFRRERKCSSIEVMTWFQNWSTSAGEVITGISSTVRLQVPTSSAWCVILKVNLSWRLDQLSSNQATKRGKFFAVSSCDLQTLGGSWYAHICKNPLRIRIVIYMITDNGVVFELIVDWCILVGYWDPRLTKCHSSKLFGKQALAHWCGCPSVAMNSGHMYWHII